MPACPQPVSTTRPLSRTCSTIAWSSCTSRSGSQSPSRQAWCAGGMPVSKSVVRSTSPVTSSMPSSRNDGCRSSTIGEAGALDRRPGSASGSSNAPSGPAIRRRVQKSGCSSTGRLRAAEPPGQPVQAHHVVEVAVAEHDRLERVRRDAEPVEVADQPVRGDAGVEEHPPGAAAGADLDQRGEAVLGAQEVDRLAGQRHPVRHRPAAGRPCRSGPSAGPGPRRAAARRRSCRSAW